MAIDPEIQGNYARTILASSFVKIHAPDNIFFFLQSVPPIKKRGRFSLLSVFCLFFWPSAETLKTSLRPRYREYVGLGEKRKKKKTRKKKKKRRMRGGGLNVGNYIAKVCEQFSDFEHGFSLSLSLPRPLSLS